MPAVDEDSGTIAAPEIRPFGEVKKGFTYFAEGDVIFAKITPCMQNGKSAIARGLSNAVGFGSTEFHVLRPESSAVCAEWLWYFVRNPSLRVEATHHFQGAVGQQRVPADFLAEHLIPIPPRTEQVRIVSRIRDLLERVDEIRRLRAESEAESRSMLPSLLKEQFLGLDANYPPVSLGEVSLESRYGTSEKCESTYVGTPVLRIPNVAGRHCNFVGLKYLSRSIPADDSLLLRPGDLLVVRTNGSPALVGRCAVVPTLERGYAYASYLIRFRLDQDMVRPAYVSYFLSSTYGRDQIARLRRTSAGQYNINSESLRSIVFPLPPIPVQDAMLEQMERIDSSVCDLQARLAVESTKENLLLGAVLRKAFAGEL